MNRPKIEEVSYYDFIARLKTATARGQRLEKSDQPAWDTYVADNKINEVAMSSWGRSKFGETEPVIINDGGSWQGYYVYSKTEEACLKWIKPDA